MIVIPMKDWKKMMQQNRKKTLVCWLFLILSLGIVLAQVVMLFNRPYKADDWEHLASAWFVFNGYLPYRDFFQHHNPLLWYLFAPIFSVLSNPLDIFYVGRVVAALFFLGGWGFIWGIIKRLGGGFSTFCITLFVYLSYPIAHLGYFQNRPDTYMIFCLLGGFYFWIRFYQERKNRDLILCYLLFFLSFAFLQKAVWLLAPFGLYQIYLLIKKEIRWTVFVKAIAIPFLIVLGYGIYLYQTDSFTRYWELNWVLNLNGFRAYKTYPVTLYDYLYGGSAILILIFNSLKGRGLVRDLSVILLLFAGIFLLMPKPYHYYWFIWTPFMSIPLGFFLDRIKYDILKVEILLPCLLYAITTFLHRDYQLSEAWYEVRDFKRRIHPTDTIISYSVPEYALLTPTLSHYYWNLSRDAILDSRLFHPHKIPDWPKQTAKDLPKFVCPYTIYDLTGVKDGTRDTILMEPDKDFLDEYYQPLKYTRIGVWQRKDTLD